MDTDLQKPAARVAARHRHQTLLNRIAQRYRVAKGYAIGPGGLETPGGKNLTLQEGAAYWLGASSSPQMVILTDVTDDRVKYKTYPFTKGDQVMERWIAADLLARGTATHLKQYGSHMDPGLKRSLESLLAGGKGRKEDMDSYKPVTLVLTPADDMKGQDLWYAAEEYGGVGGREDAKEGYVYEVASSKGRAEQAKNDRRFKVLKVTPRSGGSDE